MLFFVKQADFEQISGISYSRIVWLGQYCTNDNVYNPPYINKNNNVFTIASDTQTTNKYYDFLVTIIYK